MRKIILCLLLAALSVAGCVNPKDPSPPNVQNVQISKEKLLEEHNVYRDQRVFPDCPPLKTDPDLEVYAQKHADWMAEKDELTHSDLEVSGWSRLGENIAWGQNNEATVTREWMNSYGHKANIMNARFTNVGFGYAYSSEGRIYWCAVFGG